MNSYISMSLAKRIRIKVKIREMLRFVGCYLFKIDHVRDNDTHIHMAQWLSLAKQYHTPKYAVIQCTLIHLFMPLHDIALGRQPTWAFTVLLLLLWHRRSHSSSLCRRSRRSRCSVGSICASLRHCGLLIYLTAIQSRVRLSNCLVKGLALRLGDAELEGSGLARTVAGGESTSAPGGATVDLVEVGELSCYRISHCPRDLVS